MRLISMCCALALIPGLASAADLVDVYDLAILNDTQLQASAHARDAALQGKPIARASLLPQLSGFGSIGRQHNKITRTSDGVSTTSATSADPYSYGLTLTQVVYDHAAWLSLRQAGDSIAAAEADYQAAGQNLVLRVAEAYFNVLAARDTLRFSNAEKEALSRQLEQSQKRFDVGLAAITDVQEAQARSDLTVANVLQAEQDLATARQALAQIVNTRELALASLKAEIPLPMPAPEDPEAWVASALEDNLSLLASRIQSEIAHKDVAISRAGHYPTLSLDGRQVYSEVAGFNSGEQESSSITLNLNVPIFSGLGVRSDVRRTRSVYDQRLAELEGTRRQVERDTRDAYQGVITGSARVKALKQAVISNQTAFEAAEIGLQVGTRTAVDVLDAQQLLYSAQRDYARARYDYLISVLQLKSAAGRLRETDLVEINQLLLEE